MIIEGSGYLLTQLYKYNVETIGQTDSSSTAHYYFIDSLLFLPGAEHFW